MKKFISTTLLALTTIILIACSSQNKQSLDSDYYWISSEGNDIYNSIVNYVFKMIRFLLIN